MTRAPTSGPAGNRYGPPISWRATALFAVGGLAITVLVLGDLVHDGGRCLPPNIETANPGLYRGWVHSAHPLGVITCGSGEQDTLELMLRSLARTLTLPMLLCLASVLMGGAWGSWAAYRGGLPDALPGAAAIWLEAVPRIALFVLLQRVAPPGSPSSQRQFMVICFAAVQIPAIAATFRNHLRGLQREGFVDGLISLGFPARVIVWRDMLWRECAGLLLLQYVARVTELVALMTALSYAFDGVFPDWIGAVLVAVRNQGAQGQGNFLLLVAGLAAFLAVVHAVGRSLGRELSS